VPRTRLTGRRREQARNADADSQPLSPQDNAPAQPNHGERRIIITTRAHLGSYSRDFTPAEITVKAAPTPSAFSRASERSF